MFGKWRLVCGQKLIKKKRIAVRFNGRRNVIWLEFVNLYFCASLILTSLWVWIQMRNSYNKQSIQFKSWYFPFNGETKVWRHFSRAWFSLVGRNVSGFPKKLQNNKLLSQSARKHIWKTWKNAPQLNFTSAVPIQLVPKKGTCHISQGDAAVWRSTPRAAWVSEHAGVATYFAGEPQVESCCCWLRCQVECGCVTWLDRFLLLLLVYILWLYIPKIPLSHGSWVHDAMMNIDNI